MTPLITAAASTITLPAINYTAILPELILLGGMLVLLTISALSPRQLQTETYATFAVGIGIASLISSLILWRDVTDHGSFQAVAQAVNVDGFSVFVLVLVSAILVVAPMVGAGFLRREGMAGPEFYVLALISGTGAMLMGAANDLILIFLALEILSIPLYVMAGFDQRRAASGEAAMKYFVLGAFSSAIFVYGIALTYGATGSTNLASIGAFLARNVIGSSGVLYAGAGLMLVGFGFKIAAVPFHMWTPDVYQGSPSGMVGVMASMAKLGGFAALLRVFVSTLPTLASSWQPVIYILAILSLVLGAVVALVQRDIKRMLAYSSINHAGFVLLGLQAATDRGVAASLYYLFGYSFLVLGSFAVVSIVAAKGDASLEIESFRGLGRRSPLIATTFAVLLLAQAGAPFTTGFFAKFYVIEAIIATHSYLLAVIAMLSAAIAVFFYLRVVLVMFSIAPDENGLTEEESSGRIALSPWTSSGLGLAVLTTVVFGVWPQPLIEFAHQATLLFH